MYHEIYSFIRFFLPFFLDWSLPSTHVLKRNTQKPTTAKEIAEKRVYSFRFLRTICHVFPVVALSSILNLIRSACTPILGSAEKIDTNIPGKGRRCIFKAANHGVGLTWVCLCVCVKTLNHVMLHHQTISDKTDLLQKERKRKKQRNHKDSNRERHAHRAFIEFTVNFKALFVSLLLLLFLLHEDDYFHY